MQIFDTEAEKFVPPGIKIHDANKIAEIHFNELPEHLKNGPRPWPFTKDFIPRSKEDPAFMERPALLYTKYLTLYEGTKGASVFTNSIFQDEEGLPDVHKEIEARITIDNVSLDMLKKKLDYATKSDSVLIGLPKIKEFPKMNINPMATVGIHPLRRDISVLKALQMTSEMTICRRYNFWDRRTVDWPACILALERDGHRVVMDLKTEFVTLSKEAPEIKPITDNSREKTSRVVPIIQSHKFPVFSSSAQSTKDMPLPDISPVDWRINFEEVNFYPDPKEWRMAVKLPYKTNTVFLTNNTVNPKPQPDRFVKARCLLYLYGHAVGQARQLFGVPEDETRNENYQDLPEPIMIQGVYYNSSNNKNNIGFMALQLNTTAFDSGVKNQVWSDGPYSLEDDYEMILKKLTTLNLVGSDSATLDKLH
jgi:hypothetical protein